MKAKTEEDLKLPKYYASVIVLNKKGKVLLGKRDEDGIYTPPGGHAEDHETPSQVALRELYEEAGIKAEERDLEELPTIDTVNGRVCHCFLLVTKQDAFPDLDPDEEVSKWGWYKEDELPAGLKKDPRRFESVRNAFMKFHGIMKSKKTHAESCDCIALDKSDKYCTCGLIKGGEGSGKVGHKTFRPGVDSVHNLSAKLSDANPFKSHLTKLKTGSVLDGAELKSGKPVYTSMDAAMAHGYTPEDYNEASNINYDKMTQMNTQIQKLKTLGKDAPKEMIDIMRFHEKQFRSNHKMAEVVGKRHAESGKALNNKKEVYSLMSKLGKSIVGMGYVDSSEIDTGKFSQEHNVNLSPLMDLISLTMNGYQYGDVPRSVMLDKGTMHLTKVDDGMYSGFITLTNQGMEDNARVRIERMTIPSLSQFLLAKEYELPSPSVAGSSPGNNDTVSGGIMAMAQPAQPAMIEPMSESMPAIPMPPPIMPQVESMMDKKFQMLQLIAKLLS